MVTICDYQSVALVVTLAMLLRLINFRFIIIIISQAESDTYVFKPDFGYENLILFILNARKIRF